MCYRKCFRNGHCPKTFASGHYKVIGSKQIVYGPKLNTTAMYGDCDWDIDSKTGILTITEYHNIERHVLKMLIGPDNRSRVLDQAGMHDDIRAALDNPYIYTSLTTQRITGLVKDGLVTRGKFEGNYVLKITSKGKQVYYDLVAKNNNPFFKS